MADDKHQKVQNYIDDELAQAQQDPVGYADDDMPAEQYNSPESMHKRTSSHVGNKSFTKINRKEPK